MILSLGIASFPIGTASINCTCTAAVSTKSRRGLDRIFYFRLSGMVALRGPGNGPGSGCSAMQANITSTPPKRWSTAAVSASTCMIMTTLPEAARRRHVAADHMFTGQTGFRMTWCSPGSRSWARTEACACRWLSARRRSLADPPEKAHSLSSGTVRKRWR
jgi:hypothetical protein